MTRLIAASLIATLAFAQQTPKPDSGEVTFSSTTQLVVETVTVSDKSGKPVEGLTVKDFTVTEDGAPQTISFFEYERLPEIPAEKPEPKSTARPEPYRKLAHTRIAPESPGNPRYRDHRLLALYFDLTAMPAADQFRALDAAERFIRTQATPSDLLAVLAFQGGAVQVLADFTDDKDRLLRILETLVVGEDQDAIEADSGAADSPDTGAAFGQDDSQFNIFSTDRQLSALQTAATMLGQLNEKKSLLYFASGLQLNGVDNQAQMRATVNAAVRAGVSFWPIDARGLVAQAPLGDATRGSAGGIGMYNGAGARAMQDRFQQSQDTMYSLAADTGGKAFLDNNELSRGIAQAQRSIAGYYILGYYATNSNPDGKFRRIKVTVNSPLASSTDYRQGYFANKAFSKFTTADKERQLEDALMLGDPITELTISMELNYFQLNRAEYFVPLTVKIPGRELALARKGGAERTMIDFVGEIKDDYGTTITNLRDKVDIRLSGETAAQLATKPIEYEAGFTLLPGKYVIKFLARDAETGRIGTYQSSFTIPNLNKEEKRLPISSVVLSSQQVDMRDALFNAAKDKGKADNVNPLIDNGRKLVPSVTRVFARDRDLYVYLQAYERGATDATQPLVAFVAFYQGAVKVFETPGLPVVDGLNAKSKAVPLRFDIPLAKLNAGQYTCQVTVLQPDGQKAAFWQGPLMVTQ